MGGPGRGGPAGGLRPCGLGARDSLRLEMAYRLYGSDMDDATTPLEAGLGWVVKLDKGAFMGRDALLKQKEAGLSRKLVGFVLTEPGIPRHGHAVLQDGKPVGVVTSGTRSPSLGLSIGLAYVPPALAAEGSTFAVDIRGRAGRRQGRQDPVLPEEDPRFLNPRRPPMNFPDDLKYTKEHEWCRVKGNRVVVGITNHAQDALGDIVYVELPEVGDPVKKGESFGVVESTKAVSELFSPVTGKVVEVNDPLSDAPETINEDPYEEGWMIQVEVADFKELDALLDAAAYQKFLQEESE